MKIFWLSTFFLVFLGLRTYSQITITSANMPVAGDQIIYSTSAEPIILKNTGPNYKWDFSNLTPVANDTFVYKKPSDISFLYAFSFANSVGLQQAGTAGMEGNLYQFFKTASSSYSQVGLGINMATVNLPVKYNDEDEVYNFPLNFRRKDSTTFAANTEIPGVGKIKINGVRITEVDGWGTITTPHKTYKCIRVRSLVREIDSVAGQGFQSDRVEVKWLALEERIPVLQVTGIIQNSQIIQQSVIYRDIYRNIVNHSGPKPDFSVKNTNVFVKDTVTFANATGGMQNQYNWSFSPNTVSFISGTNASSANPVVVFNAAGKYSVTLKATNFGGSNQLTKTNYIEAKIRTSSVEETYDNKIFEVFPNPSANGIFQFSLHSQTGNNFNNNKNDNIIEVYNLQGQKILRRNITAGNGLVTIDLQNYPKGIYFLHFASGNNLKISRLLID